MDKSALVAVMLKIASELEDIGGAVIPASIRTLTALYAVKFNRSMTIEDIQGEYAAKLESAMVGYLTGQTTWTRGRNEFRRTVYSGIAYAFEAGWAAGGADPDNLTPEAIARIGAMTDEEVGFTGDLWAQLKEILAAGLPDNAEDIAQDHAANYARTLQGIYNEAIMMADRSRIAIWRLGQTEDHCETCAGLDGNEHTLGWFLDNGYIPQQRGSTTLECGGWRCDCRIEDKDGNQIMP